MKKNKEMVLSDFIVMIRNSWTYDKMTYKEKDRLLEMLDSNRTKDALKGTYNNRWNPQAPPIYYNQRMYDYFCSIFLPFLITIPLKSLATFWPARL